MGDARLHVSNAAPCLSLRHNSVSSNGGLLTTEHTVT